MLTCLPNANTEEHEAQNLSCQKRSVKVNYRRRDSAVGIATGYGRDDRGVGVRVPVGSRMFSSPRCPNRLCGAPSSFPAGKAADA
jgi:hypothetical protein